MFKLQRGTVILPLILMSFVCVLGFARRNAEPAASPLVVRASYVWIGDDYDDWSDTSAWTPTGCGSPPCYPRTGSDDANFTSGFKVTLDNNYTIDDLVIDDSPGGYIDGASSVRTLTCDTVVVSGDTGGEPGGARVANKAVVETN